MDLKEILFAAIALWFAYATQQSRQLKFIYIVRFVKEKSKYSIGGKEMNEIECSYDCPVRSQCVHSTVKSESSWHPKYIGPDGCIHFKQIQPHFEKGRWVE